MAHIGMEIGARMRDVLEDKNGMEKNVLVQEDLTSMELSVYNVLMDKFGTQFKRCALAMLVTNGMDNIVIELMNVHIIEYGMLLISSASAHKTITGLDMRACLCRPAQVDKSGISPLKNALVLGEESLMVLTVCCVQMEKFGIHKI